MSYNSQDDSTDTRECDAMRKIFVGGLNRDTTDEVFADYFKQYGTTLDIVIIRDNVSRNSKGFGFVLYDQSSCVEDVFGSRPHELDGKTLDVKRAIPKEASGTTARDRVTKLFVGGVGADLTAEELQEYIESRHPTSCGNVSKIDFLTDRETNKNKGFGFLECSSCDFADRLVISEATFELKGRNMSLKKAEPKKEGGGGGGGFFGARGGRGGRGDSRGGRGDSRGGRGGRGGGYTQNYGQSNNGWQQPYGQQSGGGYEQRSGGGYGQQQGGYDQQQQQGGYGGGYGGQQQGAGGYNQRYQPY